MEGEEQCDDGNNNRNDGCYECKIEKYFVMDFVPPYTNAEVIKTDDNSFTLTGKQRDMFTVTILLDDDNAAILKRDWKEVKLGSYEGQEKKYPSYQIYDRNYAQFDVYIGDILIINDYAGKSINFENKNDNKFEITILKLDEKGNTLKTRNEEINLKVKILN